MARRFVYASSQYLTVNGAAVVAAPFSVACWFRPASSSPAANGRLFSIGDVDATNEQWSLGYNTLNRARWSAQTSAGEQFATYTGASMVAGQWYLLVGVEESATQRRVYLNTGTANNTTSRAPAGADTMRINAKVASAVADYGDGDIAVIGLWDGVILTATDVQRLTNGLPFERLYPHRLFLWRLEENTADWRGRYPFVPGTAPAVVDGPPFLRRRRPAYSPVVKAPAAGGDIVVTPAAATAVLTTVDPTVVLGSVVVSPDPVTTVLATVDPTVAVGGLVVSPDPITAVWETVNPTVVLGSVAIAPDPATAIFVVVSPGVVMSSMTVSPSAATAVFETGAPTVAIAAPVLFLAAEIEGPGLAGVIMGPGLLAEVEGP